MTTKRTIRARIAVTVDSGGEWNANGWGGQSEPYDPYALSMACEAVGEDAARYWVEVELPIPDTPASASAPGDAVATNAEVEVAADGRGSVWVFNSERAPLPGGVFATRADAEAWIARWSLSGMLTEYPLNQSAYDWATGNGHFVPNKPATPRFVGGFTSGAQEHYHYEAGAKPS